MEKEKCNKKKVKTILAVYYKDEEDKTINQIVLRLIEKELESRFLNNGSREQDYSTLLQTFQRC